MLILTHLPRQLFFAGRSLSCVTCHTPAPVNPLSNHTKKMVNNRSIDNSVSSKAPSPSIELTRHDAWFWEDLAKHVAADPRVATEHAACVIDHAVEEASTKTQQLGN